MAMRAKELGALGLQVNEKGQVIAKTSLLTEMEALVEEAGVKCCICLEGYKNQPSKVNTLTHMYIIHNSVWYFTLWCVHNMTVLIYLQCIM